MPRTPPGEVQSLQSIMSAGPSNNPHGSTHRPIGMVAPDDEYARRALKAIEADRLDDAARNVESIAPTSRLADAWKPLLLGLIASADREDTHAEPLLWRAATWALLDEGPPAEPRRLAARAIEQIGWILRHRDRPADAEPMHARALEVRQAGGSFEEQWESTMSMGRVCQLTRRADEALDWFNRAAQLGAKSADQPEKKQAMAWSACGATLLEAGRFEHAVDAHQRACDAWRTHDPGAIDTARADARLAHAMLKRAESILPAQPVPEPSHEPAPADAAIGRPPTGEAAGQCELARLLDETIARLTATHEALLAFGPDAEADAVWTAEQLDFANRLRQMVE